jgi:hypothetical protein
MTHVVKKHADWWRIEDEAQFQFFMTPEKRKDLLPADKQGARMLWVLTPTQVVQVPKADTTVQQFMLTCYEVCTPPLNSKGPPPNGNQRQGRSA